MKVAIPHDKDGNLVSLDEAEYIGIYDDSTDKMEDKDNVGYGSKEATMESILGFEPDVITIKSGMLCPGSYMMSKGTIKYALVKSENMKDIISNKEFNDDIKDELDESIYAESGED